MGTKKVIMVSLKTETRRSLYTAAIKWQTKSKDWEQMRTKVCSCSWNSINTADVHWCLNKKNVFWLARFNLRGEHDHVVCVDIRALTRHVLLYSAAWTTDAWWSVIPLMLMHQSISALFRTVCLSVIRLEHHRRIIETLFTIMLQEICCCICFCNGCHFDISTTGNQ